MNDVVLTSIRINELETLIENSVKKALLNDTKKKIPIESDILDIKSASQFLNLAVPTIYCLVSKREITSYKRGKKLYFKKSELLQWIQSGKRLNNSEVKEKAKHFSKAAA